MENICVGDIWLHYKGGRYIILGKGIHTETGEEMVIYSPIDDRNKVWIRPISMWFDIIDKDNNIIRFKREK
ncbi:MAG: DUF1653 domain-containing protein [Clostridia bacterium]|nr:DUF1653 domain-containing protein [Clostridia bacterium]